VRLDVSGIVFRTRFCGIDLGRGHGNDKARKVHRYLAACTGNK